MSDLIDEAAKAIFDAENGIDGDTIGAMLHENDRIAVHDGDKGIPATMAVCRRAAAAAANVLLRYPDEATIVHVARAICATYGDDYDEQPEDIVQLREWRQSDVRAHDPGLPTRQDWRNMAIAAIAAYEERRR